MENLDTVRSLLRKGDWLAKIDLKDAYLTVPINSSHGKFLRFQWQDKFFLIFLFTFRPFISA